MQPQHPRPPQREQRAGQHEQRRRTPCRTATASASSTPESGTARCDGVSRPELGREQRGRLGQRRPVPGEVPAAHEHRPRLRPRLRAVVRGERVGLVGEDDEVGVDRGRVVLGQPRVPVGRAGEDVVGRRAGAARRRRTCPGPAPSTAGARSGRRRATARHLRRRRPRRRAPCRSQSGSGSAEHGAQPVERVERLVDRRRGGHPHGGSRRRAARRRPRPGSPRRWRPRGPGRSASTRSRSGHLVPPTRGTSRSAGWVHQSVAPTSRPMSVAAIASVSEGTRLTHPPRRRASDRHRPRRPASVRRARQTSVTRTPACTLYRRLTDTRLMVSASTWRALRSRPA